MHYKYKLQQQKSVNTGHSNNRSYFLKQFNTHFYSFHHSFNQGWFMRQQLLSFDCLSDRSLTYEDSQTQLNEVKPSL